MASITNLAPKIGILLGDSITQQSFTVGGWGALLADNLVRRVDLLNRGFSGYNTKFAVDNLEHIFPVKYQPGQAAFATIFFGANDACVEKAQNGNFMTHHKQHVSLENYQLNLAKISDYISEKLNVPKSHQIIISPPAIDADHWFEYGIQTYGKEDDEPNRRLDLAKTYADASKSVAEKLGTRHVALLDRMVQQANWQEFMSDGLHLSESGNKFLFDILLTEHIELLTQDVPQFLPNWRDLE